MFVQLNEFSLGYIELFTNYVFEMEKEEKKFGNRELKPWFSFV